MDRVICDVCSMDYAATEAQCPICGCARAGARQTSAGNTVTQEDGAYTPVKGGRFSKTNVRKRLKAAQIQPVPVEIPSRPEKYQEPEEEPVDQYDDEEDEELDEEGGNVSNRALIVIVALLLAAIVAVSCYIAIGVFGVKPFSGCDGCGGPAAPSTTAPAGTTAPTVPDYRIPCTNLTVDGDITLLEQGGNMTLSYSVEPIDTTDTVEFTSSNTAVATVDQQGRVTAVGSGEATITITCGEFTQICKVSCIFGEQKPDEPVKPDEPMPNLQMRDEDNDVQFSAKGYQWRAYKETDDFGADEASKFTWKTDDEAIATVDNGIVKAVAPGKTTLRVYYGDEEVGYCIIRCKWTETQQPDTPEDPEDPENPDDPAEPTGMYYLRINGLEPAYPLSDHSCEASFKVGHSFRLTLVNEDKANMNVTWTVSDEGYVSIDGDKITCLKAVKGYVILSGTYDGQTFTCLVRIS